MYIGNLVVFDFSILFFALQKWILKIFTLKIHSFTTNLKLYIFFISEDAHLFPNLVRHMLIV